MAKDNFEEETYSVMFASLKHPVRRRILRMLAEKPRGFSEVLEALTIDSGHLSYHLENLGDLVVHAQDGKYRLTSFGVSAVKLMSGVEEQPVASSKKLKPRHVAAKVYPLLLVVVLIVASFYLVEFAVPTSTAILNQDNQRPTVFSLATGQTFEFSVTLTYWAGSYPLGSSYGGFYGYTEPPNYGFLVPATPDFKSFATETMWLDLRLNSSGFQVPNTESWPIGIANNSTLTIYKPDGTALTSLLHGADGADYDAVNLWTWGGLDHYVSSPVKVGDLGTYRFVITNTGESNWNGTMLPRVQWQLMEKPYFYFGVAGVVLGAACLIFAIAELRTLKKPMENLEN